MSRNETKSEFVRAIKKRYESLNNNEEFKEKFKDANFKVLLNPKDGNFAALIIADHGTVSVEGLKNKPKENIKQNIVGWNSLMQTTRQIFKDIGDGKISGSDIPKKVITRKIKVKGLKYLASFGHMSALIRKSKE